MIGFVYVVSMGGVSKIGSSTRDRRPERVAKEVFGVGDDGGVLEGVKIWKKKSENHRDAEIMAHKELESSLIKRSLYKKETFLVSHEDAVSSCKKAISRSNKKQKTVNDCNINPDIRIWLGSDLEKYNDLYSETYSVCAGADELGLMDSYADCGELSVNLLLMMQNVCLKKMLVDAMHVIAIKDEIDRLSDKG